MKRLIFAVITLALIPLSARAEKTMVGTYRTVTPAEEVFSGALRVLTQEGFVVRFTDKSQGTVQADKMAWGSGTPAISALITISRDGDATTIVATFTKHPGMVGHSVDKWATGFGVDLKKDIPDLTAELRKK